MDQQVNKWSLLNGEHEASQIVSSIRKIKHGKRIVGGQLPINTDGGGLSSNHPGMRGIFLIIEAVRQLRGQCGSRQVPGAKLAIAHGSGGLLSSQATTILGR